LRLARLIADLTSGINQQPPSRELGVETDHILIGHFLLRAEAAQRAGIPTEELIRRPDLLHIGGTWLEEVYFEFQFDESGIRSDLGAVVQTLRRSFDDLAIAEWLARPNEELAGATPLRKLSSGGSTEQLAKAAESVGRA
jgi:hypothetical protein